MKLTDKEYGQIKDLLVGKDGDRGRSGMNNRLFIDAVLYIAKTGCGWRHLPSEYGKWYSVWQRFRRWSVNGV
jgi:transposase